MQTTHRTELRLRLTGMTLLVLLAAIVAISAAATIGSNVPSLHGGASAPASPASLGLVEPR